MAKDDANRAYQAKKVAIHSLLVRLTEKLNAHAARQKTDPKNWGYVGDLGRIEELVTEAIGGGALAGADSRFVWRDGDVKIEREGE